MKRRIIALIAVCYLILSAEGFESNASSKSECQAICSRTQISLIESVAREENTSSERILFGKKILSTRKTKEDVPLFIQPSNQYIETAIDELEISKYSTDYERCVTINNYLINRLEYDNDAAKNGINKNRNPWLTYCLEDNKAVCAGYVECFQELCLAFGIECWYNVGYVDIQDKRIFHAWARVVIDDKSYWTDPTFNDQAQESVSNLYLMKESPFDDRELKEEYEKYWLNSKDYPMQAKEE